MRKSAGHDPIRAARAGAQGAALEVPALQPVRPAPRPMTLCAYAGNLRHPRTTPISGSHLGASRTGELCSLGRGPSPRLHTGGRSEQAPLGPQDPQVAPGARVLVLTELQMPCVFFPQLCLHTHPRAGQTLHRRATDSQSPAAKSHFTQAFPKAPYI